MTRYNKERHYARYYLSGRFSSDCFGDRALCDLRAWAKIEFGMKGAWPPFSMRREEGEY